MIYTVSQTASIHQHSFAFLEVREKDHLLQITLNRPAKKNALNAVMMQELAFALSYAHHHPQVWVVLLDARGDVFCSGADLKGMMGDEENSVSSIPAPQQEIVLGDLFSQLHKPCVAKVTGHVYAGGFLLLTGCTYVVACNDIRLGLPEVKRGLFPFQVLVGLLEVMPPKKALDWCIRGLIVDAEHAFENGLLTHVVIREEINETVNRLISDILANSPTAIRLGLAAFEAISETPKKEQHKVMLKKLEECLQTQDAQEGLSAFLQKRAPEWTGQ